MKTKYLTRKVMRFNIKARRGIAMNETQFINRKKLRGAIAENGIKPAKLAEKLGITRQSVYSKIKGKPFNENEIAILRDLFGLGIFLL